MRSKLRCFIAAVLISALCAVPVLAEEPVETDEPVVYEPSEEVEFTDDIDSFMLEKREQVAQMRHLLLIGIDARPGEETGRSDTTIIVSLDPEGNIIKLTSIMRDLYVEIPGYRNNRINSSYVFGGAELLMSTIEENFGIHVESYIAVNFSMLGKLIDSIGGLTLNLGPVTISSIATALILGVLVNVIFNKRTANEEANG